MAVTRAVAVFDKVAGFYQTPFFVPSRGLATRSFIDEVNRNDDKNQFFKHAADFDLYELGLFDDHTGLFVAHAAPDLIIQGSSAKQES